MSGCAGSRYDKKEDFHILLAKNDPIEPPQLKNYLWMARWTKASSSTEPQNDSTRNRLGIHDSGILTSEFMKSTVAETLMVGVNSRNAPVQHSHRFSSNMKGLLHDVRGELGPKNYEHGDVSFGRRIKQKAVNLHAKAVLSETYSPRKLSELPLDLQNHGSSGIQSSDWNHFPMFEINRKFDNIPNPKRRSALGPASLNVKRAAFHVMASPTQEYMVHSQSRRMRDEKMDTRKPAGGSVSHLEGHAVISSDPSGRKLKRHLSDTMSCSCIKDNNLQDCQIDEQHTNHYVSDSIHELPFVSSGKKFHFAGHEKDQIDVSALHHQKSRKFAVYKQQGTAGDTFSAPLLGKEYRKEPTNCPYKSKLGGENVDGTMKSLGNDICSLPCDQKHLKTQRTESAVNLNLPYPVANTSAGNCKQLTHGKVSSQKSTCKQKGPCLYEMLATAPKSQSTCPKNSVSSGKGFDVCMYGTNIGSCLFGTQNQSSARTETLYSDTHIVSKSSAGIASSPAQKDYAYPNEAKTERLATPLARIDSDSKENESHNVNGQQDVLSKTAISSKESCMPATGITNLDLMIFQMSRMRNPISVGIVQPPVGAEPSDRWLKRLHLDALDPQIPSSKRPKVGGSPPREDSSCLLGTALRCNRTDNEELIDCVKEDGVSDEGNKLQDDQRLHVPAKSMNHWIGRWCKGGTPVFHGDPGRRRQATKPDQASEELGGLFPSIAAMAMMGRVMNKLRPCEHRKKGPFVVWKTE